MDHSGLDLPAIFSGDFVLRRNCWNEEGRIQFQDSENSVSPWRKPDRSLFLSHINRAQGEAIRGILRAQPSPTLHLALAWPLILFLLVQDGSTRISGSRQNEGEPQRTKQKCSHRTLLLTFHYLELLWLQKRLGCNLYSGRPCARPGREAPTMVLSGH